MCELDLSMIDLTAKEIFFEVDPAGITKTFRRSGAGMKKGHLNILQGTTSGLGCFS
jgi:hypothetical protein